MASTSIMNFLVKAGIIVGSGGLIFGYDIGVIAGTISQLQTSFNLSDFEEGLVVAIIYAGAVLGSVLGGPLCDYIGRWRCIQVQNVVFVFGAVLTASAQNVGTLYAGRFVVGIASALSGISDVPYLLEVSPAEYRGVLSGQYEILVCVGVLLSFLVDLLFCSTSSSGWRIAFFLPSIFAILQSVGMFFLPESPRWLLQKGRVEEARQALSLIHQTSVDDVAIDGLLTSLMSSHTSTDAEFMQDNVINKLHSDGESPSPMLQHHFAAAPVERADLALMKDYQYPIALITALQILAQITGGVVIRNYAPTIFEDSGVSPALALFYNLLLGLVKLFSTIVAVVYIEKLGRKLLLMVGGALVGVGMALLTLNSALRSGPQLNLAGYIVGCSFCLGGYGVGYGPVPWAMSSEMFPTAIRGRVVSISLLVSNLAQLIVNLCFLPVVDSSLGAAGTFGLFAVANIAALLFFRCFLVETRNISPSEILASLLERYVLSTRSFSNFFDAMFMWRGKESLGYVRNSTHSSHGVPLSPASSPDINREKM